MVVMLEKNEDLFSLPQGYVFVHCISLDCEMGKGIAKMFVERYPSLKRRLRENSTTYRVGYSAIMISNEEECRSVINLITKERFWQKPTYESLEGCLRSAAIICSRYGVRKIAMPRIGCGLDRLSWIRVREIVLDVFKDLDIEIMVCYV